MTPETPRAKIAEIAIADEPAHWEALGFAVAADTTRLGSVRVRLAGTDAGRGILGWSLRDAASIELDGLPTIISTHAPHDQSPAHPNGIAGIDHLVAMSPDLDRTVQALQAAGLDLRRIREQPTPAGAPRQAFFRLGGIILEVVQEPDGAIAARPDGRERPARFWGLALLSDNLPRTVEQLGEHASEIRAAVQPGRQIATLKRSARLAVPVALMSRAVA
jgi:hypothetical protein